MSVSGIKPVSSVHCCILPQRALSVSVDAYPNRLSDPEVRASYLYKPNMGICESVFTRCGIEIAEY